jgi:hypothetical protein
VNENSYVYGRVNACRMLYQKIKFVCGRYVTVGPSARPYPLPLNAPSRVGHADCPQQAADPCLPCGQCGQSTFTSHGCFVDNVDNWFLGCPHCPHCVGRGCAELIVDNVDHLDSQLNPLNPVCLKNRQLFTVNIYPYSPQCPQTAQNRMNRRSQRGHRARFHTVHNASTASTTS